MTPLLALESVAKAFAQRRSGRTIRAVDGVSLTVGRGETLGIAGESGCGKSTLARLALRLLDPTEGAIRFDGRDITRMTGRHLLPVRRRLQAVFQDPLASLNPARTIRAILREPFDAHGIKPPGGLGSRIDALLKAVGLEGIDVGRLPGEFSGGQLQRVAIARALALEPDLIVGDEPTSALDPSIQAQIVNLLLDIQRIRNVGYLIISHDLEVLGHMSDRLAIMYLGIVVETGPGSRLLAEPLHPYTQALLSAAPTLKARRDPSWQRVLLQGDPPNPAAVPPGCRFHPRCPIARDICRREAPRLAEPEGGGHAVACHLAPDHTAATGRRIAEARLGRGAAARVEADAEGGPI